MNKITVTFLILFVFMDLLAIESNLPEIMNEILMSNPKLSQSRNRLEREKAEYQINSSLNWLDITASWQNYTNEIDREEIRQRTEVSDIEEKDDRYKLEISKSFFPKDFDNISDKIDYMIDSFEMSEKLKLEKIYKLLDIFDDLIEYQYLQKKITIQTDKYQTLNTKNQILEKLFIDNVIDPTALIQNIETINTLEDNIANCKKKCFSLETNYSIFYDDFSVSFDNFQRNSWEIVDTMSFHLYINNQKKKLDQKNKKILKALDRNRIYSFFPEITFNLSMNKRKTEQEWIITEEENIEKMTRNIEEIYPQTELEFALPFDIINNNRGKLNLLNSYYKDLLLITTELQHDYSELYYIAVSNYKKNLKRYLRKRRISELQSLYFKNQMAKYQNNPDILGDDPDLSITLEKLKKEEAVLELDLIENKLYRDIFVINFIGEILNEEEK